MAGSGPVKKTDATCAGAGLKSSVVAAEATVASTEGEDVAWRRGPTQECPGVVYGYGNRPSADIVKTYGDVAKRKGIWL